MAGRSRTKPDYSSDRGEMDEDMPLGKLRRRSKRKSSKVERLQITHSPTPSIQSLVSRRTQNVAAPTLTTLSTGTSTSFTSTKPVTSTPQSMQPSYTGSYHNYLAQDRYGSGGGHGHSGGGGAVAGLPVPPTSLTSLISWAARGNGLRDIREADIEDFLTNYWTTSLAVTSHALHRTSSVDNDVFTKAHNDLPWKDQGNIVFLCEGGKIVRAHGVLLNAILPRFVSDLMDIHKYVMVPTYNTSPHLPVFIKGIDARCIEHFLTLANRSMVFMTGREIMQLKRMIEVLNIQELSVFVAHSGGINGNALRAADAGVGSNVLASGTSLVAPAVAGSSSAQNFGGGTPSSSVGLPASAMGSPYIISPHPRVSQSGQDLAAAKQPPIEVRSLFQQDGSERRKGKKEPIYANASSRATSLLETSGNESDVFELNVSTDKSAPGETRIPLSPSPRVMPPPPPAATASGGGRRRRRKVEVVPERKETPTSPPPPVEKKRRSTRVKSESSSSDKNQRDSSEGNAVVEASNSDERKKRRASYTKELREAAVSAMKNGAAIVDVSEQFNVDPRTLSRWKYENKRAGSDTNLAAHVESQTTAGPNSVENDTDARTVTSASDSSTVNSPAPVEGDSSSLSVQARLGPCALPAPVAETPTIGFDSILMKDPPIDSYFNGNSNVMYPQAMHHSDLITFNNMAMAIHVPSSSHHQNMAGTYDNRGKENVHTDLIEGTGAGPGPGPGRNPSLDMPTVLGMDMVVGSTSSIELEQSN